MALCVTPVRKPFYQCGVSERILAYSSDDALLDRIMRQGAEAASARAEKTIEEVREIIGFRKI